jgi:LemA protein
MIEWIITGFIIFVCLVVLGWVIGFYNTVINAKNDIKNMLSNIFTEYQRRADLFMNLVESVKGVSKFEKSTLKEVIEARSGKFNVSNNSDGLKKLKSLDNTFDRMNLLVEQYPQLTSTKSYEKLMDEIRLTEDRINVARTDYNAIVRDYNTYITMFPATILSSIFSFNLELFFDTDKKNYNSPKIDLSI